LNYRSTTLNWSSS